MARQCWSDIRVLITGGSGFIGSHLCDRLCDEGSEVHATSRNQRQSVSGGPRWWQVDMSDVAAVRHVLDEVRPQIIFHLAGAVGASPDLGLVLSTYQSLLTSTVNVLLGATEIGCRRIILTGSLTEPLDQAEPPVPQSPYAAAKWAGVGYGRMFHCLFSTPVVILRPFMVYGPAQAPQKLIPAAILSLLKEKPPQIASGRRRADWVYISDAIDGFLAAALVPSVEGATIDLGSGSLTSIRSIIEELVAIVGCNVEPLFGAFADRPGEFEIAANTAVASDLLGWTATTSLTNGLRQTVDWYKSRPRADWTN